MDSPKLSKVDSKSQLRIQEIIVEAAAAPKKEEDIQVKIPFQPSSSSPSAGAGSESAASPKETRKILSSPSPTSVPEKADVNGNSSSNGSASPSKEIDEELDSIEHEPVDLREKIILSQQQAAEQLKNSEAMRISAEISRSSVDIEERPSTEMSRESIDQEAFDEDDSGESLSVRLIRKTQSLPHVNPKLRRPGTMPHPRTQARTRSNNNSLRGADDEDGIRKWAEHYMNSPRYFEKGTYFTEPSPPPKDGPGSRLSLRRLKKSSDKDAEDKKESQKDKDGEHQVGSPFNLVHTTHVDTKDLTWTTKQDPNEIFSFKEELGKGAFATVYKAVHRESGVELAIKVVPTKQEMKEPLQKEIEVLRKCKSNNILAYYGTVTTFDAVWVLMDCCAVGSVKDLMKFTLETLDEPQISYITSETLKGLVHLHIMKILHLDVKTGNILLTADGKVKIADFGVSEQIQRGSRMITPTDFVGSPLFMAPEVIRKARFNNKADIWSLGVTLIEMAEGRPPNSNIKSMKELIDLPNRPPPFLKQPGLWSHSFKDFIAKCTIKDPDKRPDAQDLLFHPFVQKPPGPECLAVLIKDCLRVRKSQATKELEENHDMIVQVKEARNLNTKDSDTYCTLSLKDQNFKTSVCKKGNPPSWGGDFKFDLVGCTLEGTLEISCFEKAFSNDRFLGQVRISMSDIHRYLDKDTTFGLQPSESNPKKVSGDLILNIALRSKTPQNPPST